MVRCGGQAHLCRELVDAANRNGGGDNITAVCIEVTEEDLK